MEPTPSFVENHKRPKYKDWYLNGGKEYLKQNRQDRVERCRAFVYEYLLEHPCTDCGEPCPVVLDFDHIRGEKTECIAHMIKRAYSLKRLSEEMNKCEVVCRNCHQLRTSKRAKHYRYRRWMEKSR